MTIKKSDFKVGKPVIFVRETGGFALLGTIGKVAYLTASAAENWKDKDRYVWIIIDRQGPWEQDAWCTLIEDVAPINNNRQASMAVLKQ